MAYMLGYPQPPQMNLAQEGPGDWQLSPREALLLCGRLPLRPAPGPACWLSRRPSLHLPNLPGGGSRELARDAGGGRQRGGSGTAGSQSFRGPLGRPRNWNRRRVGGAQTDGEGGTGGGRGP